MTISYNWLQTYFNEPLPPANEIARGLIFHSFEVEGVEQIAGDYLLDVKILPDRAHDCLCHLGIAGELSAIFELPLRPYAGDYQQDPLSISVGQSVAELKIVNEAPDLCRRYVGRRLEGVTLAPSPAWLAERLSAAGQRPILNLVDATNYVMFDLGQPLHVFDADKVVGAIIIRRAVAGEKFTTLDGRDLVLSPDNLIIADEQGPLALAGIKGGIRAGVDQTTKNIILEAANFDPVNIRRTSNQFNLRTDASKRFENDLSSEVSLTALYHLTVLIDQLNPEQKIIIGPVIDIYPKPVKATIIQISPEEVNHSLGLTIPGEVQEKILQRLGIGVEPDGQAGWRLTIPARRVDLELKPNIVEEVGRIYGYEKIVPQVLTAQLPATEEKEGARQFRLSNKIKEILLKQGFTEVYGYAFTDHGEIELKNPLASDKAWLRQALSPWLKDRLYFNLQHLLFDTEPVKIFEIGHTFRRNHKGIEETKSFAFGIARHGTKQKIQDQVNRELMEAKDALCRDLSLRTCPASDQLAQVDAANNFTFAIIETNLDDLLDLAADTTKPNLSAYLAPAMAYQKISVFPRVLRDIALWIPAQTTESEVETIIKNSAGDLLQEGPVLFDRFPKDDRVSVAFRLAFQSYQRTLSDDEVNEIMNKVITALEEKGWEVRK